MGAVAGVGAGVYVEMAAAAGALLGVGVQFVAVEEPDAARGEFDEREEFGGTVVGHPPIERGRAFAAGGFGGEIGFHLNGVGAGAGGGVGDEVDAGIGGEWRRFNAVAEEFELDEQFAEPADLLGGECWGRHLLQGCKLGEQTEDQNRLGV